jgi:hypothetical protein
MRKKVVSKIKYNHPKKLPKINGRNAREVCFVA